MREGVSFVRERGRPVSVPAPLAAFLGRHRPTWAISGAGGLLLAGVDAFGSGGAPPLTLYTYWLGMMLATGLLTSALGERLERKPALAERPFALSALIIVGIAIAMTPFVWIVAAAVLGGSPRPAKMATIFPQALLILTAFVALQWAMERRRPPPQAATVPPRPDRQPAFLDRLPEKLKGADLHAIEAEDHYLRLHTERGSALILMRLADAMAELAGLEGARTHRSWWVARNAVLHASRGRGRALLKLKGGIEAPVSRTYAPALRRAGWF